MIRVAVRVRVLVRVGEVEQDSISILFMRTVTFLFSGVECDDNQNERTGGVRGGYRYCQDVIICELAHVLYEDVRSILLEVR